MRKPSVLKLLLDNAVGKSSTEVSVEDCFRLRKCKVKNVNLLLNVHFNGEEDVLIVDLAENEVTATESAHETLNGHTNGMDSNQTLQDEHGMSVLGGSPLKPKFLDVSNMKIRETNNQLPSTKPTRRNPNELELRPISTVKARRELSDYLLARDFDENDNIAIWFSTDGSDPSKTIMVGTEIKGQRIITRAITVKNNGQQINSTDLPMLTAVKDKIGFNSGSEKSAISTWYCEILDPTLLEKEEEETMVVDGEEKGSEGGIGSSVEAAQLSLSASWRQSTKLLQQPPPDAKVIMTINPGWADSRSPLADGYEEIETLIEFNHALKENSKGWSMESCHPVSALQNTEQLIKETGSMMYLTDRNNADGATSVLGGIFFRKDLDFTERLWNVLKCCENNQELILCLAKIFDSLKHGKLSPMVHTGNGTSLAKYIRDAYREELLVPRLDGLLPLQILVELGVGKLQRDYVAALLDSGTGSELLTSAELTAFIEAKDDLDVQVFGLRLLHSTLEVVLLAKKFLSLPNPLLNTLARKCLSHFKTNKSSQEVSTSLEMRASDICSAFERWQPEKWSIGLQCVRPGNVPVATVFLVCKTLPVDATCLAIEIPKGHVEKSWQESLYALQLLENSFNYA